MLYDTIFVLYLQKTKNMNKLQVGKPVKGDELIGRETEIETILNLLSHGQSVVIIAPRRLGKTSVILELLTRLKQRNNYTAYIDVFTTPDLPSLSQKITEQVLNNKKLGKVFIKIRNDITEIIRNVELKQTIESFEFILKYASPDQDNWELFSESIDFIEAYPEKYNKEMICAFDEFGDINKFNGDSLVKMIRSKIQLHNRATYLFSGSYESVMDSIFVKPNSPFFRFARIINLGYIEKNEFKKYLFNTLQSNKIAVSENLINEVLGFTKGHPYYTQLILQQIILNYSTGTKLHDITLKNILQQILIIENNFLEKQWEDISKSRELVQSLLVVIKKRESLYSVIDTKKINLGRALKRLSGKGIIYIEKGKYQLSDPLFELWIIENVIR